MRSYFHFPDTLVPLNLNKNDSNEKKKTEIFFPALFIQRNQERTRQEPVNSGFKSWPHLPLFFHQMFCWCFLLVNACVTSSAGLYPCWSSNQLSYSSVAVGWRGRILGLPMKADWVYFYFPVQTPYLQLHAELGEKEERLIEKQEQMKERERESRNVVWSKGKCLILWKRLRAIINITVLIFLSVIFRL